MSQTLSKQERLCSKKLIETLFAARGRHSVVAFPLRAVWLCVDGVEGEPAATMLVSVPKRYYKRAVRRNHIKRQVREAFRRHKDTLAQAAARSGRRVAVAFVWLAEKTISTAEVEARVATLLERVAEQVSARQEEA